MSTSTIVTMDTPTLSPRKRYAPGEGDRLRQDLLVAAGELMVTTGDIDTISLRAVARKVGVSPTAVYRHFDDHLDLLREAVDSCWSDFRTVLEEAAATTDDPFIAFRAMGDAYVRFALERTGQYRVLFSNKVDIGHESSPGLTAFWVLVDIVERMLAANDDPRDPFFVSVQVHTWVHGMVDLCGSHPGVPWPPTDELLDGLGVALELVPRAAPAD